MGKILKDFKVSKIVSHTSKGNGGKLGLGGFGTNSHKMNPGLKSGTKGVKMNGK